jgi:hypothetical protein
MLNVLGNIGTELILGNIPTETPCTSMTGRIPTL